MMNSQLTRLVAELAMALRWALPQMRRDVNKMRELAPTDQATIEAQVMLGMADRALEKFDRLSGVQ